MIYMDIALIHSTRLRINPERVEGLKNQSIRLAQDCPEFTEGQGF